MEYIDLLPTNVHEEIIKRVPTDKPFEVTIIEEEKSNEISFQRPLDISKEIDEEFNKLSSLYSELKTIKINITQCLYHKNKNIFIGQNLHGQMIIFDGNKKVYFCKNDYILLSEEANKKLLEKFKEWSHCNACNTCNSCNKCEICIKCNACYESIFNNYIQLKQYCCNCNTKLEQKHLTCYKKCQGKNNRAVHSWYRYLCDNCIIQCDVCMKINCKKHVIFCQQCNKYLCDDHIFYCGSCYTYYCKEHPDSDICKTIKN